MKGFKSPSFVAMNLLFLIGLLIQATNQISTNDTLSKISIEFSDPKPTLSNGKVVEIGWTIQDGRPVSCHLSKDKEEFRTFTCTSDQTMEFVNLATGFYQFYVLAKTTTTDRLEFSRVIDFRVVNQKPRIISSTQNIANGYASNDFLIKFGYEHPIDCELYCKFSSPNDNIDLEESPDLTGLKECLLDNYKPSNSLEDGAKYSFVLYAVDAVNNTQGLLVRFIADSQPPVFTSSLTNVSLSCGDAVPTPELNDLALVDNLDTNPQLSYQDIKIYSCLVQRIWTAVDHVNNKATISQFFSFVSNDQLVFDSTIYLACSNNIIEDIKYDKAFVRLSPNLCQSELVVKDLSPVTPLPPENCGFSTQVKMKMATDCMRTFDEIIIYVKTGQIELPILPLDEQEDVDLRPQLRWEARTNVKSTSLLLRTSNDSSSPTVFDVSSGTNFSFSQDLIPDTSYLWRLEFTLNNESSEKSPFWSFKTKAVADLALLDFKTTSESIVPGEMVVVNWQGINYGKVTTSVNMWNDTIYGSDSTDPSTMRVLGSAAQAIQLAPNAKYKGQFRFKLDERYSKKFYFLWLQVDSANAVQDSDRQNNWFGPVQLDVDKPKLPNLVPQSIAVPNPVFAGDTNFVVVTVENLGESDIPAGQWLDSVVLSLVGGKTLETRFEVVNALEPVNDSYVLSIMFTLPIADYGDAMVTFSADHNGSLFESNIYDNTMLKSFKILRSDQDTTTTPHSITSGSTEPSNTNSSSLSSTTLTASSPPTTLTASSPPTTLTDRPPASVNSTSSTPKSPSNGSTSSTTVNFIFILVALIQFAPIWN